MNKVVLIGNLSRDPDLRQTGTGTKGCNLTVAVDWRDLKQGGNLEADFIPVVCWRGLGENCAKYLKKGSKVGVSGSINVRRYEDKSGSKRYVTEVLADEVEFLDRKEKGSPDATLEIPLEDEELPF